jgi:hypothetical protein
VTKRFIFISCGQFTAEERYLGTQIAALVREQTDLEPFFAEQVHDLNGLDANILDALRDCVAFIVILHPRGEITRPDGSVHVRASVWIEQEIAIATYIQRVERRLLPIIAFQHESVDREGIRDLLSLNPIKFSDETEVLEALPEHLRGWKTLTPSGIRIELHPGRSRQKDGHSVRKVGVSLVNDTNQRLSEYTCEIHISSGLREHSRSSPIIEMDGRISGRGRFRFTEAEKGPVGPHDKKALALFEYCTKCASEAAEFPLPVAGQAIEARAWIGGREYGVTKTVEELADESDKLSSY